VHAAVGGSLIASNILRGDYAGSRACADCHSAIYASWEASAMRGMTRDARDAAIRAPFDGASLRVGDDTCTMEMRDGQRTMRVVTAGATQLFRVTKVIGGRYREDFVGTDAHGEEHVLPATYVFATRSWRYKGYSVMVPERRGLEAPEPGAAPNPGTTARPATRRTVTLGRERLDQVEVRVVPSGPTEQLHRMGRGLGGTAGLLDTDGGGEIFHRLAGVIFIEIAIRDRTAASRRSTAAEPRRSGP
jgi:hypothetical protein